LWTKKEQESKEITIKGGAKYVTDVKKDEFVTAVKPVWEKFSPTPELKKLIQDVVDTK
jgi:TRAP-type C4-dicarboxylate transport system substrate-binding protein